MKNLTYLNKIIQSIKQGRKTSILPLYITLIITASVLITVNYYSIKLLSALRAGISGQSIYARAQLEETRNMVLYLQTEDEQYFNRFISAYRVHQNFYHARILLLNRAPEDVATNALLKSGLDAVDVNDIWFLLHTMRKLSFLKKSMAVWIKSDNSILTTYLTAIRIHKLVESRQKPDDVEPVRLTKNSNSPIKVLTGAEKSDFTSQFILLTETETESALKARFSDILNKAARNLNTAAFIFNILFTLLFIGLTTFIASKLLKKLRLAADEMVKSNLILQRTNIELDKFIYSASHDLRSPISSLQGLIDIIEEDSLPEQLQYLTMMRECIERQDRFIKEIINYSANQVVDLQVVPINLNNLINSVISHKSAKINTAELVFDLDIQVDELFTDPERLRIILNSTIDNAIQYRDPERQRPVISLTAINILNNTVLTVGDNGIGIKKEDLPKIFDMFFVTGHKNRGSGVGLYNVKETVEKLGGNISVSSTPGTGTIFTISLPNHITNLKT